MNFVLLGYIIAWIATVWVIAAIAFTAYEYNKLTQLDKAIIAVNGGIDASKHLVVLIISVVYIIVYHIS